MLVSLQKLCCSTKMKNDFRNWSDVRIFLAVVRHGSTLAASRKLGIAQPTVARRIDALEAAIGLTLFERETRGFKPTSAALDLVKSAEALEQAAAVFLDRACTMSQTRPIRITAPGLFSDKANDIFSDFIAKNPGVNFEFVPSLKVLDLTKGEADIAIRITRDVPDKSLICRTISIARWALFAGQPYADKHGLPSSLNDLSGHRFVTFQNEDVPDYQHKWLLEKVLPDQILMSFLEPGLMQAAVRAGHGLGLLNLSLAEADSGLICCSDPVEELTRANLMLISPEAYRRPEVRGRRVSSSRLACFPCLCAGSLRSCA